MRFLRIARRYHEYLPPSTAKDTVGILWDLSLQSRVGARASWRDRDGDSTGPVSACMKNLVLDCGQQNPPRQIRASSPELLQAPATLLRWPPRSAQLKPRELALARLIPEGSPQ